MIVSEAILKKPQHVEIRFQSLLSIRTYNHRQQNSTPGVHPKHSGLFQIF